MDVGIMGAEEQVSMDDILVFRVAENLCKIVPPKKTDTPEIVALKNFIMACLHRRNIDEEFDDEMRNWLNGFTLEEFREAVSRQSPPNRNN